MTREQWIILIAVLVAVFAIWLWDKIKNGKDD